MASALNSIGKRISGRVRRAFSRKTQKLDAKRDEVTFSYSIDSPTREIIPSETVTVRGWLIVEGNEKVVAIRAVNNGIVHEVLYGEERLDVAKARPKVDESKSRWSGFFAEFPFENGRLSIEVNFGKGFKPIHQIEIKYSPEKLFESYYNKNLGEVMAEHQVTLDNKKNYYHESELDASYEPNALDPRLVALYLPQFHPIPQNDLAWGKGFTEWTNVTTAQPRFLAHQQPILPEGLGFYDLRYEDTLRQQVELAKKYGIHAFCFYYYWFSGEQVLETPLNNFLKHKEWDFNFMICWANENWTKRWDGRDTDVIIAQKYLESDPLRFIKDVEPILLDTRYVRQNGRPLLAVYRGTELKEPQRYIKIWRDYFKKKHGLDLEIVTMLNFDPADPRPMGFDAGIEFAPLTHYRNPEFNKKRSRYMDLQKRIIDLDYSGYIADYRAFLPASNPHPNLPFPSYKSLSPSWDNEARKKGKGSLTLYGSNPDLYGDWLDTILSNETANGDSPLIFINAWNEWAEGTMLEPTRHDGYARLNRTAQVLSKYSKESKNRISFPRYGYKKRREADIAVIVHIFYEDDWAYVLKRLKYLEDKKFDVYITLAKRSEHMMDAIRSEVPGVQIVTVPNRGRDILPFLFVANRLRSIGYKYVLKLHLKKSTHRSDGDVWFKELVDGLLPSKSVVGKVVGALESGVGLIGPKQHFISNKSYIGSNRQQIKRYVEDLHGDSSLIDSVLEDGGYFAGSMFWARLDALDDLFNLDLIVEDFESERGQIDGTLAHTVERLFTILPSLAGKDIAQVSRNGVEKVEARDIISDYVYARPSSPIAKGGKRER